MGSSKCPSCHKAKLELKEVEIGSMEGNEVALIHLVCPKCKNDICVIGAVVYE